MKYLREGLVPAGQPGKLMTAFMKQGRGAKPATVRQSNGGDGTERTVPQPRADAENGSAETGREIRHDVRRLDAERLQCAAQAAVRHHVAGAQLQADLRICACSNGGNAEIDQRLR